MLKLHTEAPEEQAGEMCLSLDELAREGARRMLAAALEAEVAEYLERHRGERDEQGQALVVKNGRARPRKLTLGAGTVEISAPRRMTTALVAALYFGSNQERARLLLASPHYVPHMLSKSRFNRRMHRLTPLFEVLFAHLAEVWKQLKATSTYIIDTFPIPALDNIRIPRAQLYQEEAFRGYIPSKRRYFFGLRRSGLRPRRSWWCRTCTTRRGTCGASPASRSRTRTGSGPSPP
ncbi:MAG: transposase, partial [Chloroflexota bacterium]|nr:transposase [Chloroflexota bacterium]